MRITGKGTSKVMLVGEALGYNEAVQGIPFVPQAPAGAMLNRVLKRHVKVDRDEFHIANAVWCRPPKNALEGMWYKNQAIQHCAPHLNEAIHRLKPKAIVALGGIAAERLLALGKGIQDIQNYAFWSSEYNAWIVPALHPSFIQRGANKYQPVLGHAIKKALRIADEGYSFEKINTIHEARAGELREWVAKYKERLASNPTIPLAFDIETRWKGAKDESTLKEDEGDPTFDIMQISFAYGPSEGISVAWDGSTIPAIKEALAIEGTKIVWNRNYDVPRLLHHGVQFGGPIRDSMIAWHCLQTDLDKGLGFVTPLIPANHRIPYWKGASEEEGGWWYSAMDSVMLWRNDHHTLAMLKKEGIFDGYRKYVEEVRPILDDMQNAGILVDPEAQAQFIVDTEDKLHDLEDEMQAHVPDGIRNLHPKEGFKKLPKELEGDVIEHRLVKTKGFRQVTIPNQKWKECEICRMRNPTKAHFKTYKAKAHLHKNTPCSGARAVEVVGDEYRWAKVLPFKPSSTQLLKYAKAKNYRVKLNYKTGSPTMDEEAITGMLKQHPKDPLLPLVLEHRGVQKEFGLYGPDGLLIGEDGRVHTHFSDNPSTLRFASYGPNMQNIPRDSEIRGFFVAGLGCLLGARDFSGIEAVLVGYFAVDRDYTRLAKMGVHDYFNAHIAYDRGTLLASDLPNLSASDEDLQAHLQELKESLDATRPIAKMGVHMSNYIGTPLRLFQQAPSLFGSVAGAAHIQDLYFEVFPKIQTWQRTTCAMAERQTYLRSPFGFVHRFYQVYTYKKDEDSGQWVKVLGDDAKRCVAFNPQHTAAMIMRRAIRDAGATWVREFLRLTIHDELLWECPIEKDEEVDEEIRKIMEAPNTTLPLDPSWGMGDYLAIGTEGKYGHRWKEMKKRR